MHTVACGCAELMDLLVSIIEGGAGASVRSAALAVWHKLALCGAGMVQCLHHPRALALLLHLLEPPAARGDRAALSLAQLAASVLCTLARSEKVGPLPSSPCSYAQTPPPMPSSGMTYRWDQP